MSAHTPGSWALDWNVSRIDVFSSDAKTLIATIRRSAMSEGIDAAARANARLIAAAPELLEALKLCAAVCAGDTTSKSGLINALEKARAAIAKTTGATP